MSQITEAYREAQRRISAARVGGLKELDLNGLYIDALPPEISELDQLTYLNLSNNYVSNIDRISNLINLEVLLLYSTEVNDISALARMKRLRRLDLAYLNINNIDTLRGCTQLHSLNLKTLNIVDLRPLRDIAFTREEAFNADGIVQYETDSISSFDPVASSLMFNLPALVAYLNTVDDEEYDLRLRTWQRKFSRSTSDGDARQARPSPNSVPISSRQRDQARILLAAAEANSAISISLLYETEHAINLYCNLNGFNELPQQLAIIKDVASAFLWLSEALRLPAGTGVEETAAAIAVLEEKVEDLTAQLRSETARADKAEARLSLEGFGTAYRKVLGEEAARLTTWVVKLGLLTGTAYFLGNNSSLTEELVKALQESML